MLNPNLNPSMIVLYIAAALMVMSCKESNSPGANNADSPRYPELSAPPADYELLFMGNSHSSMNGLPQLVVKMIERNNPELTGLAVNAPGYFFLDERLEDGVSDVFLKSRNWSHVILQAQKYSTTGRYSYPTDASKTWIDRTKTQGAIPIMFPEWPRRGNFEEGTRVHQLHVGIAMEAPACVAPVGLAWDAAIAENPQLDLHAPDGNHSNLAGALLAAFVIYGTVTGNEVSLLPFLEDVAVPDPTQQFLRNIAATTLNNHPPCIYLGSP